MLPDYTVVRRPPTRCISKFALNYSLPIELWHVCVLIKKMFQSRKRNILRQRINCNVFFYKQCQVRVTNENCNWQSSTQVCSSAWGVGPKLLNNMKIQPGPGRVCLLNFCRNCRHVLDLLKRSLLHRLQAQTLPNATSPIDKISPFRTIRIIFEPLMPPFSKPMQYSKFFDRRQHFNLAWRYRKAGGSEMVTK